jgi:PAS domain S-box-containing protein
MNGTGDEDVSRSYFERSPVGAFVVDETGTYVDANPAACELLGYTRDELLSMSLGDVDAGATVSVIADLRENGELRSERRFEHRDGHMIDVVFDAVAVGDDRFLGICHDVTERKEYEESLRESEARYRSMTNALDTSTVGTFVLDSDFDVVWINEAVEEFFGISRADLLGEDKADMIRTEIRQIFEDPDRFADTVIASYEDNSYVESFRCHVLPAGGREERWLLHWSAPIERGLYAGGRIEHYTDITETVRYERRLEEQRDNLSTLNEVMRHDIRNDLQMILAHAELLADHVDDEAAEHVEAIRENAAEAVDFTTTARETAALMLSTEGEYRPVRLETVLASALDEIRATAPDAVVSDSLAVDGVSIRADDLLESVFRNLLKNAIQHNDSEVPEVAVTAVERGDTAVVRIADNGPGIPDEQKGTVFRKGEAALDSGGTGLGLYLVSTLVERYGGEVRVEDRTDPLSTDDPEDPDDHTGAVFVVELPTTD